MASADLEWEPYEWDDYDAIEYLPTADSTGNIVVTDEWSRGVVGVVTGDIPKETSLDPAKGRLLNNSAYDSIAEEESVQWGLGRLVDAPVVTGEINGIRYKFTGEGRSDRGVERLEPFDTLLTSMDASRFSGVVQHIFTEVEGEAPSSEALRESFKTDSGTWSTRYHPSVSDIDASW